MQYINGTVSQQKIMALPKIKAPIDIETDL